MENKRPTRGHIGAQYSILKNALSKLLTLGVSLLIAGPALSAVIGINMSQSPDNVIEVAGDLEASVEYTASGLKIEIPGVTIKLTCDGDEVSEQSPCTIDLTQGNGSSLNPGGGDDNATPKEGDDCTLDDGSKGVIEGGKCTAADTDPDGVEAPKEGDDCTLDDGSKGVIEGGKCTAADTDPDGVEAPKEGDDCTLDDGSKGVIEGGKCTAPNPYAGVADGEACEFAPGVAGKVENEVCVEAEPEPEGKYDSFCAAGRNPNFGANPVKFDEVCNPDGTVKDGVDNTVGGDGFNLGGGARPDDNCGSQGYDPTCTAGGAGNSADTAVPFPQGAQRVVETVRLGSEILDFGSADRDAVFSVSRLFDVAKGKVSAIDFTLAPETPLTEYCANGEEVAPKFAGKWSDRCKDDKTPKTVADFCADGPDNSPSFFGDWSNSCEEDGTPKPNATPPLYERLDPNTFKLTLAESGITAGGNVHLWISTQRDGERVSEDCSSIPRFPEGPVIRAGVGDDSDSACRLEAGEKYYLMVAFCTAPEGVDDYNCTNPNTQTALRTVKVYTTPGWRRVEAQN